MENLWHLRPAPAGFFDPEAIDDRPEPVRRYLCHALSPRAPMASAVRLKMRGEIRLGRWRPFEAEEVIVWNRGFIWQAKSRMFGLRLSGADQFVDGRGRSHWTVAGVIPVADLENADIAQSAAGRLVLESIWVPSVLCSPDVEWEQRGTDRFSARIATCGYAGEPKFQIRPDGALEAVSMRRWGNPGGGPFRFEEMGGYVEEEKRFGSFVIPSRMRAGWYFGTPRFEESGEFFRVRIEAAAFE